MISKIKNLINSKKIMTEKFFLSSGYLEPGEYKSDNIITYFYKNDTETLNKKRKMFDNGYTKISVDKGFFKRLLILFIKNFIIKPPLIIKEESEKDPLFQGSVCLPASSGKEVKIFDIKGNKVLILFFDQEVYHKKLKNYNTFKKIFNIPEVIFKDDEKLIIVEKYIDYKPHIEWADCEYNNVIYDLFQIEFEYLKECKKNENFYYQSMEEILNGFPGKSKLLDFFTSRFDDDFIKKKIPFAPLHGDMWTSNILISRDKEEGIFYIDWERSDYFFVLYDFCSMMVNESLLNSNNIYIYNFMNGEYDRFLQNILGLFDVTMEQNNRAVYLYITMILEYMDMWSGLGEKAQARILEKISKICNRIEQYHL